MKSQLSSAHTASASLRAFPPPPVDAIRTHYPRLLSRGKERALDLLVAAILLFIPSFAAMAHAGAPMIHVDGAKARPTAQGMTTGVVYMLVMNHGDADDTLTGVSTPVAERAEMHRSLTENGVSRMIPAPNVAVKADDLVSFEPGGLHVMLIGLKQQLKPGDSFKLTLSFAKAGAVETTVTVQAVSKADGAKHDMPGMKM